MICRLNGKGLCCGKSVRGGCGNGESRFAGWAGVEGETSHSGGGLGGDIANSLVDYDGGGGAIDFPCKGYFKAFRDKNPVACEGDHFRRGLSRDSRAIGAQFNKDASVDRVGGNMIPSTIANHNETAGSVVVGLKNQIHFIERVGEFGIVREVINGGDLKRAEFIVKDAHVIDLSCPGATQLGGIIANHEGAA